MYPHVDSGRLGDNIAVVPGDTASDCCAPCQQREECAGAVLSDGHCYLKNVENMTDRRHADGTTLVSRQALPPLPPYTPSPSPGPSPPGQECDVYKDTNNVGGQSIYTTDVSSASECCSLCGITPGCAAATFVNNQCYLKKNATASYNRPAPGQTTVLPHSPLPPGPLPPPGARSQAHFRFTPMSAYSARLDQADFFGSEKDKVGYVLGWIISDPPGDLKWIDKPPLHPKLHPGNVSTWVKSQTLVQFYSIRVALVPGAKYTVSVGNYKYNLSVPGFEGPSTIMAIGDPEYQFADWAHYDVRPVLSEIFYAKIPDIIIFGGDNFYQAHGGAGSWAQEYFEHTTEQGKPLSVEKVLLAVVGNHDYETGGLTQGQRFDMSSHPQQGKCVGSCNVTACWMLTQYAMDGYMSASLEWSAHDKQMVPSPSKGSLPPQECLSNYAVPWMYTLGFYALGTIGVITIDNAWTYKAIEAQMGTEIWEQGLDALYAQGCEAVLVTGHWNEAQDGANSNMRQWAKYLQQFAPKMKILGNAGHDHHNYLDRNVQRTDPVTLITGANGHADGASAAAQTCQDAIDGCCPSLIWYEKESKDWKWQFGGWHQEGGGQWVSKGVCYGLFPSTTTTPPVNLSTQYRERNQALKMGNTVPFSPLAYLSGDDEDNENVPPLTTVNAKLLMNERLGVPSDLASLYGFRDGRPRCDPLWRLGMLPIENRQDCKRLCWCDDAAPPLSGDRQALLQSGDRISPFDEYDYQYYRNHGGRFPPKG